MEKIPFSQENKEIIIERPFLTVAQESGFSIDKEDILSTIGVSENEYIEKINALPENERVSALLENGILAHAAPDKNWSFRWGRPILFSKVNDHVIPFYRSKQGTDGKNQGGWYPFLGFGDNWLVKTNAENMNNGYTVPPLKKIITILNNTLNYDQEIDKAYSVNSSIGSAIAGRLYQERDNPNFDPADIIQDHVVLGKKDEFMSPNRMNKELFGVEDEMMNLENGIDMIRASEPKGELHELLKEYKKKMDWQEFQW